MMSLLIFCEAHYNEIPLVLIKYTMHFQNIEYRNNTYIYNISITIIQMHCVFYVKFAISVKHSNINKFALNTVLYKYVYSKHT